MTTALRQDHKGVRKVELHIVFCLEVSIQSSWIVCDFSVRWPQSAVCEFIVSVKGLIYAVKESAKPDVQVICAFAFLTY